MNKKLKILLADDSKFFRAIESKFLQKTPVEILDAENCSEALSVIRNDRPDLVYMAFSLPDKGGAACCRSIKDDPASRALPVVLICDQGEPEQEVIAKQNGCDAILSKPLDRHSFLQVGRQFLAGIREHRQPSFFPLVFTTGGEEFDGKCLDISGGGMFIECQADIPAGTLINLEFKLPTSDATQISCSGEVMWLNCKPTPMKPHYPHGLGVKFVGLSDVVQKAIIRLSDKQKQKI